MAECLDVDLKDLIRVDALKILSSNDNKIMSEI